METLIGSILDTVFASLAESAERSNWLHSGFVNDPEKRAFRVALTQALADAGQHFPGSNLRYFGEVLREVGGPLLARTLQSDEPWPTAAELTERWLNHLNLDSVRYDRAAFERVATIFLASLHTHLQTQEVLQSASVDDAQWQEQLARQSQINTAGGAAIGGNLHVGGDFVGRDQITIRNYFIDGLGRLPFDYYARIEEFLLEYLGSRRKRVPFGGRNAQLAALDVWLQDCTAPPYYLMTAEAGRGKSALVCRWQTQILMQPDIEVIFIPISIRFETATQDVVFAALAARLAASYGETMQAAVLSADQWRATCQSYLRRDPPAGKQLVVILDGLDEAIGWTPGRGLFPGDPPEGLRVLVTARQRAGETGPQGWANTLGWDDDRLARKVTLSGLDRAGVQEALASMGNPLDQLATQVDVVGELYRLTEGDPLLVRLYVDALMGQGNDVAYLRAEELATIQPGLHGYFDRWWDEQHAQWRSEGRDPLVEQEHLLTLLNAVAAALGPLTHSDLAAVSTLTNGLLVRRLAQTVSRWLLGDGKSHGYTFSHPRLGYYFWEQLGETEQADWDARFTAWGTTILAALHSGEVAPNVAPRYLVQHYAAHLTRANAPAEKFYALLSDGWRQAWEAVDVTYSGFLNDIVCAEAKAQGAYQPKQPGKAEAIVQQVKAALCRVSISALWDNVTPALLRLVLCHKLRTPTQIIALIRLMRDEGRRSEALATSVKYLPVELVAESLTIARGIGDEYARADALGALAPYLPPLLLTEALAAARGIRKEDACADALGALAPYLPPLLLTEALAAARSIGREAYCARALDALAPHLPEAQQPAVLTEALAAARRIRNENVRAGVLGALALHLPEAQQPAVLTEALAAAREIWDQNARAKALGALAPYLPPLSLTEALAAALAQARGMGDKNARTSALEALAPRLPLPLLTEALAAAREIQFEYGRAEALGALAPYLPPLLLTEALAAARGIGGEDARASALGALAPHLPEAQQPAVLTEALAAAGGIRDEAYRAGVLGALAPHLPPQLLTEALAAAREIQHEDVRARALGALAPHLPPLLLTEVLAAARGIRDEDVRAWVLGALAPHLPPQLLTEALAAAREIQHEDDRAWVLGALAPHLPPLLLTEALAAAREIGAASARARALGALAPHLPEAQQPAVLTEALAAARRIGDEYARAEALGALARHLPEAQQPLLLTEALAAAREIQHEDDRARALGALAPHLPPLLLTEALAAARRIRKEAARASALGALALHLPEAQRPTVLMEALAAAGGNGDENARAWVLGALVPHLPPLLLTEALAAARRMENEYYNSTRVFEALASHLPPAVLAAAREIQHEDVRARVLGALAPHLPPLLLTEALAAAREIKQEDARARALGALAPHLPPLLLTEALAAARGIGGEDVRARALGALAPHLPEAQQPAVLTEALAAARRIRNEDVRAEALGALAPHLPEAQQPAVLTEALAAARRIRNEDARAKALGALSPHLPPLLLTEALAAARGIGDEYARVEALGTLALHLSEAQQPAVLTEALAAALAAGREIQHEYDSLPEAQQGERMLEALSTSWNEHEDTIARVLGTLAPHLSPLLLTEALAAARGIGDEYARARALGALGPHLPPPLLTEALAAARGIGGEYARADVLDTFAPYLTAWQKKFPEAAYLEWTRTIHQLSQRPRPQFLRDIQSLLPFILALADEEAPQAATGIFHALRDVCAWWP